MDPQFWAALAGIVWIDLLLSGDNAVVIAMVCRGLPPTQRRAGIVLGAAAAVGLRIVFAFIVAWLIAVPGLSLAGGLFLLYVAAKLLADDAGHGDDKPASASLWSAVATIAIADVGMSLDNVMAIAALARGDVILMATGVLLSIPIVIAGSAIISGVIARFPILIWAGAGLLGWVGGGIIATDPYVLGYLRPDPTALHFSLAGAGLAFVLAVGLLTRRTPTTTAA